MYLFVLWRSTEEFKSLIRDDWTQYESIWQATELDKLEEALEDAATVAAVIAVFQ